MLSMEKLHRESRSAAFYSIVFDVAEVPPATVRQVLTNQGIQHIVLASGDLKRDHSGQVQWSILSLSEKYCCHDKGWRGREREWEIGMYDSWLKHFALQSDHQLLNYNVASQLSDIPGWIVRKHVNYNNQSLLNLVYRKC
ncbi:hypothetical protein RRG08_016446 [Elysia crispata]|uniref:Uncharacterized protein n=1 Tax=Elysia crispata TaxID=231223 RepID=A0AAE0Y8R3_9GAST|nr:hypothetical protein RRG08_016446 [Elysia crispata]